MAACGRRASTYKVIALNTYGCLRQEGVDLYSYGPIKLLPQILRAVCGRRASTYEVMALLIYVVMAYIAMPDAVVAYISYGVHRYGPYNNGIYTCGSDSYLIWFRPRQL